jgi:hypothetical protein
MERYRTRLLNWHEWFVSYMLEYSTKTKKMYDKGRRQIAKHLFVMMDEIDSHSDRIAFYDDENDTMIRNENGYLSACNKLMKQKEVMEKTHELIVLLGILINSCAAYPML